MENQISLDNELALQIIEVLKGQTIHVAESSIELATKILKIRSTVQ